MLDKQEYLRGYKNGQLDRQYRDRPLIVALTAPSEGYSQGYHDGYCKLEKHFKEDQNG